MLTASGGSRATGSGADRRASSDRGERCCCGSAEGLVRPVQWAPGSPDGGPQKVRIAGPASGPRAVLPARRLLQQVRAAPPVVLPEDDAGRGLIWILGGGGDPVAIEGVAVVPDWALSDAGRPTAAIAAVEHPGRPGRARRPPASAGHAASSGATVGRHGAGLFSKNACGVRVVVVPLDLPVARPLVHRDRLGERPVGVEADDVDPSSRVSVSRRRSIREPRPAPRQASSTHIRLISPTPSAIRWTPPQATGAPVADREHERPGGGGHGRHVVGGAGVEAAWEAAVELVEVAPHRPPGRGGPGRRRRATRSRRATSRSAVARASVRRCSLALGERRQGVRRGPRSGRPASAGTADTAGVGATRRLRRSEGSAATVTSPSTSSRRSTRLR